jgi:hypothetical protein
MADTQTTTAANLNLLVFTLNANRNHITNILHGAGLVPQAPMPPYNADRHLDKPVLYVPPPPAPVNSAWMQNQQQMQMMALMQARYGGGRLPPGMGMPAQYYYQQNRVKTEDLEKQVKDDVFKALEEGIELDQCDPGMLRVIPCSHTAHKSLAEEERLIHRCANQDHPFPASAQSPHLHAPPRTRQGEL